MTRRLPFLGLASLAATLAAEPITLDNGIVRIAVEPQRGGALSLIILEKAADFPLIAGRGARTAGSGKLFAPALEMNGVAAGSFAMSVESRTMDALELRASLVDVSPGLEWTRRIRLPPGESRIEIEDALSNASDRSFPVRLGTDSLQQAEPWRLTDRSWIGGDGSCFPLTTSDREAPPADAHARGGRLFWRQIEQYGTGFLYRPAIYSLEGTMTAGVLRGAGEAVQVVLRSGQRTLAARGRLDLRAEVTVDEGGGAPDQDNAFYPVLVRADFAHAGRGGQPLLGCATLAAHAGGKFLVVVSTDRELARREMQLEPGIVARLPISFVPSSAGWAEIQVRVTRAGRVEGMAKTTALIDGDSRDPVWQRYTQRMKEEHYHGDWEQIGEQMVRGGQPIGTPTAMPFSIAKDGEADNGLAYYEKTYPYYAALIRGMARASGVAPNRIFLRASDEEARGGCMDAVYYGPDGPINAFSKERYEGDFHGDGYVRVIPTKGYPFHYFESYGVNSEGLSISGAASSEDWHTHQVAEDRLRRRVRAGGHTLPAKAGLWLIYATCRNVEEALRIITNPEAPLVFTGNMFLVDRAGNAARVESVGIEQQVFRHSEGQGGLFIAGNFLHPRSDGLFQIGQWSWSANSMLRERFLQRFVGSRQGSMSLQDVFAVMQTHEAGGMCQHHHDDPGRLYTACSYVAVPKTSELWLSQGPPCEVGYVRYSLAP